MPISSSRKSEIDAFARLFFAAGDIDLCAEGHYFQELLVIRGADDEWIRPSLGTRL
jgi:hypothetical protein